MGEALTEAELRADPAFQRFAERWQECLRLTREQRVDAAIEAGVEALGMLQGLAARSPDLLGPNLADGFDYVSRLYKVAGDTKAAETFARYSIAVYRQLKGNNEPAVGFRAAGAFSHFGDMAYLNGDIRTALIAKGGAIDIRKLYPADLPAEQLHAQAVDLDDYANRLSDTRDHEAALAADVESVALFRRLEPTAHHLGGLAIALNNLSNRLGDVDRFAEAVDAAQEALRLYDILDTRGHVIEGGRPMAENNLAAHLARSQRYEEAERAARSALAAYRALATDDPAKYTLDLIKALSNLAGALMRRYRFAEAVERIDEARRALGAEIRAGRTPTEDWSSAFLINIGEILEYAGDRAGAYAMWRETLGLLDDRPLRLRITALFASWLILHSDEPMAGNVLKEALRDVQTDDDRRVVRQVGQMLRTEPPGLPDWVVAKIPQAHETLVRRWADSAEPAALENFFREQAAVLTGPEFRLTMAVFMAISPDDADLVAMQRSLDLVEAVGVEEAFSRTRARADRLAALDRWMALTDQGASERFLIAHRDSLVHAGTIPALAGRDDQVSRRHSAILELAFLADIEEIYAWVRDPAEAQDAALAALDDDDVLRFGLILDVNPVLRQAALIGLLAALLRDDRPAADAAIAFIADRASSEKRRQIVADLRWFGAHHPDIEVHDLMARLGHAR
jgi:tetratricopeptide (TPR) repeat protein